MLPPAALSRYDSNDHDETFDPQVGTAVDPLKKRIWFLLVLVLLAFGGMFAANRLHPVGAARRLLRSSEAWEQKWPFPRGKYALVRLNNVLFDLGIVRPVQMDVRGFKMELDPRDLVTQSILLSGIWEPESTLIVEALPEGAVFIDVGAHVGYYTLNASKRVGNSGRVVAVEPNPPTADRLRRNIRLNDESNVSVQQVACTDAETTLHFFQAGSENTGSSSISKDNAHSRQEIDVRGEPLDSIVKELALTRIDLVKIDVEGAELQVLRGMTRSLAMYRPRIIIELVEENLKNVGASVTEVREFFRQYGYVQKRQVDGDNYLWAPSAIQAAAPGAHSPKTSRGLKSLP
jgi:FkbM family methyltransferase